MQGGNCGPSGIPRQAVSSVILFAFSHGPCQGSLMLGGGGGAFRGRQMLPYVFRNTCSSTFLPCLWLLTLQALYQTCEKSTEPALTLQD